MIPERDSFLVKAEVERRRRLAAEERAAREARRTAAAARREPAEREARPRGALGWLRRIPGARN